MKYRDIHIIQIIQYNYTWINYNELSTLHETGIGFVKYTRIVSTLHTIA